MAAFARAKTIVPTEALRFEAGSLRFSAHMSCRPSTVRLAESVAASDECHGFFVVHRHARESLADITRGGDGIRIAVRAFRVDVNQTHLHCG